MRPAPPASPTPIAATIGTVPEAERLIADLLAAIAELTEVLTQETTLVRVARLSQAMRLAPRKAELSRRYLVGAAAVRVNCTFLAKHLPERSRELRRRHEELQPLLKSNLTVLATAHAVSESIVRGAAAELARKAAPKTYGSSGRANAPATRAAQPIAFSRSL